MSLNRTFSVAPMMDCTDRHARFFLRLITRRALLYTEMVTTGAIIHGNREHLLGFDAFEHPVALQLGGSDPAELAQCAGVGADYGYDEINLNVGCPSNRVQSGRFGACLMAEPHLVGDCVQAMRKAVSLPVTVKTRIGIDDQDSYAFLSRFVQVVADAGCQTFIFHARKAWLQGLSPKENREVPPLRYDLVYRIKRDFPDLQVILNGGIKSLDAARAHLSMVDGVMMGREAYDNPYILAQVDHLLYGDAHPVATRREILEQFLPYIEAQLLRGMRLNQMSRHILGLFQGQPGARAWRRYASEYVHRPGAGTEVLVQAANRMAETATSFGTRTPVDRRETSVHGSR